MNLKPFILLTFVISACSTQEISTSNPPGWNLVWSDEFNERKLSESKWSFDLGGGGWGNEEAQYYRKENVKLENGKLIITAEKENYGGYRFTSARITTRRKGDWIYGRFEIRARLPKGKGIWPAIWLLPTNEKYGKWPKSGEIDIVELVGHEPKKIHGTLHYGVPHTHTGNSYSLQHGDFTDNYHVFSIQWERDEIRWYMDDKLYHSQTRWFTSSASQPAPFDEKFHLIINVAVGGRWPGYPDKITKFPQKLEIDWVRVYQRIKK